MSSATLKQELTSHQKIPPKMGKKRKIITDSKSLVFWERKVIAPIRIQNLNLNLPGGKLSTGRWWFFSNIFGHVHPEHWGRCSPILDGCKHIFFRMGLVKKPPQPLLDSPSSIGTRPKTRRSLHVSFVKVDRWDLTLSGTQGPRFAPGEMAETAGFLYLWMVHDTWVVFGDVGLNVTNLYESWFCLKLTSLKMGHVLVVEFEVLGFIVEATDRLEVRDLRESPWLADRKKVAPTRSTMNFQGRRRPSIEP